MKVTPVYGFCALRLSVAAAFLTACGGSPPIGTPGALPDTHSIPRELSRVQHAPNADGVPTGRPSPTSYRLLYTFGAPPDGTDLRWQNGSS